MLQLLLILEYSLTPLNPVPWHPMIFLKSLHTVSGGACEIWGLHIFNSLTFHIMLFFISVCHIYDHIMLLENLNIYILCQKELLLQLIHYFCSNFCSSLGQNLQTSTYIWENCFAVSISIFGFLLILYFIGNLQVGAQHLFIIILF